MVFQLGHKINLGKQRALGSKRTPQQLLNQSIALKGKIHNEGIKNPFYGKTHSIEARARMSLAAKGRPSNRKGIKMSPETCLKMSIAATKRRGALSPAWKGGLTAANRIIRGRIEYKLWREAVFTRDNFTCVECGAHGVYLEADHIKQFAYYPELRFAIDNGRTLCKVCHQKTDTYRLRIREPVPSPVQVERSNLAKQGKALIKNVSPNR